MNDALSRTLVIQIKCIIQARAIDSILILYTQRLKSKRTEINFGIEDLFFSVNFSIFENFTTIYFLVNIYTFEITHTLMNLRYFLKFLQIIISIVK